MQSTTQDVRKQSEPVDKPGDAMVAVDPAVAVLLTTVCVNTWLGAKPLTNASGFFFRRDARLFLVTNRHVLADVPSNHFPDRIEIDLHTSARDLTRYAVFSIPLYGGGLGLWRQATDSAGNVDVAAIEINVGSLPRGTVLQAFDTTSLEARGENAGIGDALTVIGFPLGFHDTVHRLAIARGASIASAYGVRFQQQGYFLTDARTHRGSSGSPVLRHRRLAHHADTSTPSWQLLGIHSTRMDMRTRDTAEDESLGLNCAWYADVLVAITQ
jgi:V8-like Glu-specific endopeptidase